MNYPPNENSTDFILPPIPTNSDIVVSVAMITYNHENYIAQAIESVLMQRTNFNFELIIGEDFSSDSTCSIVKKYSQRYPEKIQLITYPNNQGMLRNFYNVLSACRGKYVALLDGDDYWTSQEKLQIQVNFLDKNRDHSICFHDTYCFYEDNSQPSYVYPDKNKDRSFRLEDLLFENFISTCSVLYRNRLFIEFPSWLFNLKLGDWPLHIFNAKFGKIGYLKENMSAYRIHKSGAWSTNKRLDIIQSTENMLMMIDKYLDYKYTKLIKATIANWYYELFLEGDKNIGFEESISLAKTCLSCRKFYKYRDFLMLKHMFMHAYFPSNLKKIIRNFYYKICFMKS